MRPKDRARAKQLKEALISYSSFVHPLPGIKETAALDCFVEQLIESIRRVKYIGVIGARDISARRKDPTDEIFDPIYAAICHRREGNMDEAFWLVFLFVHFGKNAKGGWRYLKDIYGGLGKQALWTWSRLCVNPKDFQDWLHDNMSEIRQSHLAGGFGNHRKYQSLDAFGSSGTGLAFVSYVNWTGRQRSHQRLFKFHCEQANGNPFFAFDSLYRSMDSVASFGRTAKFDYLTMIGKLGLADIQPGSVYKT